MLRMAKCDVWNSTGVSKRTIASRFFVIDLKDIVDASVFHLCKRYKNIDINGDQRKYENALQNALEKLSAWSNSRTSVGKCILIGTTLTQIPALH